MGDNIKTYFKEVGFEVVVGTYVAEVGTSVGVL
jgi:hypothetical protein